ncbi:DHH family phosphoesterase [Halorhodospira sp. 9622]|uniref:single-stranded-DNA-specific exonuclease RecJ n=1 Tax=Halorhodospira sp. 9622 TaxID=2899136 RepID=UPI001EE88948|nr:DHH family phosphoesterase [Halorhodospira sp. 9622]MCG5539272.1 DHH family phosphoesterase [Halorhodospira sp. 9622]
MSPRIIRRELVDELSFERLQRTIGPLLLAETYARRGIREAKQLEYDINKLPSPEGLPGLIPAAQRLFLALNNGERVALIADCAPDAAYSLAVAYRGLRDMGMDVRYYLQSSKRERFGLSRQMVDQAFEDHAPHLIVAIDHGTGSSEGVAHANGLGAEVIISDYHHPSGTRPDAVAIVNPALPENTFPAQHLCGAAVAYSIVSALRALAHHREHPAGDYEARWLLDIVATATIAAKMPLDPCNRHLAGSGLRIIGAGFACPGLQALFDVAQRPMFSAGSADLSEEIHPRISAGFHHGDLHLVIDCLLSEDEELAKTLARDLDDSYARATALEQSMLEEAMEQLDDPTRLSATVYAEHWPESMMSTLAGRLAERLHRPVIALTSVGGWLQGAAYSMSPFDLCDAFDTLQRQGSRVLIDHRQLRNHVELTADHWNRPRLADRFEEAVAEQVGGKVPAPVIYSDGDPGLDGLSLDLALAVEAGGPWGDGFEEPTFDSRFLVVNQRSAGAADEHTLYTLIPAGTPEPTKHQVEAIHRYCPRSMAAQVGQTVRMVYRLRVARHEGGKRLQLQVLAMGSIEEVTEVA